MRTIYRAYCRSVTQANCAPYAIVIAVVVMCMLVLGIDRLVAEHLAQVIAVARDTAAVVLCGIAAILLARSAQAVAAAKGTHYSYRLRTIGKPAPAPGRTIIGEHADGTPATAEAPAGSYTWKIRPPAPGKPDRVTPLAADMAGMAAEADALRDGDMEVLVSPRGSIFECNDADADLLEGP